MATKKLQVIANLCPSDNIIKNSVDEYFVDHPIDATTLGKVCPAFVESGSAVKCSPLEGYPLEVVTQIEPVQSGSGDPSPENIRPITGHTSVTLTRCGKNLFDDVAWFESHGFTPQADGSWLGKGVNERCFTNTTKQPGSMYLTATMKTDVTTVPCYLYAYYTDGTISSTLDLRQTETFTTKKLTTDPTKTVDYIQWTFGGGGAYYIKDVQISFVDDKYETCRGDTFTLDLGQTVYGGSLDWKTGVLTVDRAIYTLDGTEAWTIKTDSGCADGLYYHRCEFAVNYDPKDISIGISSHYPYNTSMTALGFWVERRVYKKLGVRIVCAYETADELATFLAEQYAAGTPVQVCYQLKNPITVQLTPTEVLALAGTNTLISDCGETTVSGRSDPIALIENLTNAVIALGGTV